MNGVETNLTRSCDMISFSYKCCEFHSEWKCILQTICYDFNDFYSDFRNKCNEKFVLVVFFLFRQNSTF